MMAGEKQESVAREWLQRHLVIDGIEGDKPDIPTMAALVYLYGFQLHNTELESFRKLVLKSLELLSGGTTSA